MRARRELDGAVEVLVPITDPLSVGQVVARQELAVDRARLVRYAGASGDFNPIHWDPAFARSVGLTGTIAHGMWTMGAAVGCVVAWAGDPGAVRDYRTRFTRPIPVPDGDPVLLAVVASVGALDEPGPGGRRTARVDLKVALSDGTSVLGRAQATVRLP